MAETLMNYYIDWNTAESEFHRGLELNLSYATARMWRGTLYAAQGRTKESIAEIRRAEELDPLSMIILTDEGRDLYFARQYDAAVEQYLKSLRVDPTFAIAQKGLAEVYLQKSMFDEAVMEVERPIELSKRSIFILDDLGLIYAASGKKDEAMRVLNELNTLSMEEYVPAYGRAAIYTALGEKERAIEWLGRAFEEKSFLVFLNVDPIFDPIRNDERFKSILSKMGLD